MHRPMAFAVRARVIRTAGLGVQQHPPGPRKARDERPGTRLGSGGRGGNVPSSQAVLLEAGACLTTRGTDASWLERVPAGKRRTAAFSGPAAQGTGRLVFFALPSTDPLVSTKLTGGGLSLSAPSCGSGPVLPAPLSQSE